MYNRCTPCILFCLSSLGERIVGTALITKSGNQIKYCCCFTTHDRLCCLQLIIIWLLARLLPVYWNHNIPMNFCLLLIEYLLLHQPWSRGDNTFGSVRLFVWVVRAMLCTTSWLQFFIFARPRCWDQGHTPKLIRCLLERLTFLHLNFQMLKENQKHIKS